MKSTLLLLLTTLLYATSCHSQPVVRKHQLAPVAIADTLTILFYGMLNDRGNAANVAAARWAIKYYSVAGCVVWKEIIDSVEKHNNKIDTILTKRFGKNWSEQLYQNTLAEEELQNKQIQPLADSFVKMRLSPSKYDYRRINYNMWPTIDNNVYKVHVTGWEDNPGGGSIVHYYNLLVNYRTKTVTLLR